MAKIGIILSMRSSPVLVDYVKANLKFPEGTELVVRGAQDHLSEDEVRAMTDGVETIYPDLLSCGTLVCFRKEDLLVNLRTAHDWLMDQGCIATMTFCGFDYSEVSNVKKLLIPYKVFSSTVAAVTPAGGTVGLIHPLQETMELEAEEWHFLHDFGIKTLHTTAAPVVPGTADYEMLSEEEIATAEERPREAAIELVEQGADIVVLACTAFTAEQRRELIEACGKPVLEPMGLSVHALTMMYGLDE